MFFTHCLEEGLGKVVFMLSFHPFECEMIQDMVQIYSNSVVFPLSNRFTSLLNL